MKEKRAEVEETDDSCFYYYQATSGENIFLHPLNLQIIQYERELAKKVLIQRENLAKLEENKTTGTQVHEDFAFASLPKTIKGTIVEM